MSTAGLINRYVWLVTTICNRGPISRAELERRFEAHFGRGEELGERTFHRYTDAVEKLFDIEIKYDRGRQGYIIADREEIDNMSMRRWLLQTFTVNSALNGNQDLKSRILLENVPSGQLFLTPIVGAMRESVKLHITYRSFYHKEAYSFDVEPWCVKLFEQRWYMLGKTDMFEEPHIYALDRVLALDTTAEKFKLPKKFDAEKLFADCYGIILNDKDFEVCPVALEVDAWQRNFLRSLPLHHSQVEVENTDEHSIFEFRLCPSFDFRQKILSMGCAVNVLAPAALRTKVYEEGLGEGHATAEELAEYKFRVYKK